MREPRLHPPFVLVLLAGLLTPALAGCLVDDLATASVTEANAETAALAYHAIDPERLSKAVHGILPIEILRIAASVDGILLHLEVHRPDTDEPVPTILHSSPYNALERVPGAYPVTMFPQQRFVQEFVPRGYAVVVADVRGFGESGGCVEVWSAKEQQDQADLVDWIASQPWSDGNVGMIGVSYPGTTPMLAASLAPEGLKAIVAVAGLTDPYFDWHYGGVPNGESIGSPVAYQAIGALAPVHLGAGADWALHAANAGCGLRELVSGAYRTDGVYTDYYWERNITTRVKDVKAATLYTQGFRDANVKPAMALNWFNEIEAPKKGIFGQWAHSNPVRSDWSTIVHAWFDEHLKGIDTGIMEGPTVEVSTNVDTWRADTAWPPRGVPLRELYLDAATRSLADAPAADAEVSFRADRLGAEGVLGSLLPGRDDTSVTFRSDSLSADLYIAGVPTFTFHAAIDEPNAFFSAALYEIRGETRTRITFGMQNAALRESLEKYVPVPAGEVIEYTLQFQPREYVVSNGSRLELVLEGAGVFSTSTPEAWPGATVRLLTGETTPTRLTLPVLEGRPDSSLPWES